MTAGQGDLGLGLHGEPAGERVRIASMVTIDVAIRVRRADVGELAAHESRLAAINKTSKDNCRWLRE